MTNRKSFLFHILISFLVFAKNSELKATPPTNIIEEEFDSRNLKNFFSFSASVCSSKKFFSNILNHSSYPKFGSLDAWKKVCKKFSSLEHPTLKFIKENFSIKQVSLKRGLLTGYYEPTIKISKEESVKFKYPILKYNKIYIGLTRKQIELNYKKKDALLWTDSKIDLFFLQIQGSGIGVFENKTKIKISYSGNNEIKYRSIGKFLIKKNFISRKNVNLFTIKKFLNQSEEKVIDKILNYNERYIFFKIDNNVKEFAKGALGMQLKPMVSIAVDKKYYPLGILMLLKPKDEKPFLAIASDVGSAIKGSNRADIYTGRGKKAEEIAGKLKKKLLLYTLVPYSE